MKTINKISAVMVVGILSLAASSSAFAGCYGYYYGW